MKIMFTLAAGAALAMTAGCGPSAREGDIMSEQNQAADPFGEEPEVVVPDDTDFGGNGQADGLDEGNAN